MAPNRPALGVELWPGGNRDPPSGSAGHRRWLQYIGHVRQGLDPLLQATRMDIPDSWRQTILDIFEYHPGKMLERIKDSTGFTIVHGDVNPGNVLYPVKDGRVYFLDRQPFTWSLTTWLGVSDLSYLMVQYWDTELRRDLEIAILKEYHRQLMANGVTGYDWDQLLTDYKLCVVQGVYTAAEWCIKRKIVSGCGGSGGWNWRGP
jgi:thiamine kinase-like enzyme